MIGLKRHVGQIGELLIIWVEAMRPLEDAGKNWLKMAAFSTMMVAVDLRPQQIGRRKEENPGDFDCQISCHSA
ncbi:hypothetical protein TNCV_4130101 [Trichonephila clavipes]|nr:hypothetical protein TNCV_4130101 [Trichonephila clavipes]